MGYQSFDYLKPILISDVSNVADSTQFPRMSNNGAEDKAESELMLLNNLL